MKRLRLMGAAFIGVAALSSSGIHAATITYTDSYNYYNPKSLVDWSKEWALIAGTTASFSWNFDLITQGFNPLTENVLSVELSVRLADDKAVIPDSQPDNPALDGKEWASITADSQAFLTEELNAPQSYVFLLSPNSIQDDGLLNITLSTVPDIYGDFVFDRSSLTVETSAVPLPAALCLFGSGLLGLLGLARRKT